MIKTSMYRPAVRQLEHWDDDDDDDDDDTVSKWVKYPTHSYHIY